MDIKNYLKQLFSKVEQSSVSNPVSHEILKRSEQHLTDYEYWKNTGASQRLVDWVIEEYAVSQSNPQGLDDAIDFMDNPHAKGFILYYQNKQQESDYLFLLDFLKERILEIGYRSYMSDVKSYAKNDEVETVQRHYLKPTPSFEPPVNQEFGNITIELVFRNDKTKLLRLSAMPYSDRMYKEARQFSQLMNSLS